MVKKRIHQELMMDRSLDGLTLSFICLLLSEINKKLKALKLTKPLKNVS